MLREVREQERARLHARERNPALVIPAEDLRE